MSGVLNSGVLQNTYDLGKLACAGYVDRCDAQLFRCHAFGPLLHLHSRALVQAKRVTSFKTQKQAL